VNPVSLYCAVKTEDNVMNKIRLADMIESVSDELLYANSLRSKRKHLMIFDECELEIGIEAETGEGGKLKLWVLELGGDKKRTNSGTIKVKFKALGEPYLVYPVTEDEEPGPELGYRSEQS
jgi:hypothetical protein